MERPISTSPIPVSLSPSPPQSPRSGSMNKPSIDISSGSNSPTFKNGFIGGGMGDNSSGLLGRTSRLTSFDSVNGSREGIVAVNRVMSINELGMERGRKDSSKTTYSAIATGLSKANHSPSKQTSNTPLSPSSTSQKAPSVSRASSIVSSNRSSSVSKVTGLFKRRSTSFSKSNSSAVQKNEKGSNVNEKRESANGTINITFEGYEDLERNGDNKIEDWEVINPTTKSENTSQTNLVQVKQIRKRESTGRISTSKLRILLYHLLCCKSLVFSFPFSCTLLIVSISVNSSLNDVISSFNALP
jgi:hypothetical protein